VPVVINVGTGAGRIGVTPRPARRCQATTWCAYSRLTSGESPKSWNTREAIASCSFTQRCSSLDAGSTHGCRPPPASESGSGRVLRAAVVPFPSTPARARDRQHYARTVRIGDLRAR
jgi:hypothetical protein